MISAFRWLRAFHIYVTVLCSGDLDPNTISKERGVSRGQVFPVPN